MSERKYRAKEEIVADYDVKIQYHKKCIEALEAKKQRTLNPQRRPKKTSMKNVIDLAKRRGLTIEQIVEKLGLNIEEKSE